MQIYEHWLMATLQSITRKRKKCFHHICMRWKCSNKKKKRLAWPLSDKTQIRTAQDIADDLSVFLNNTYILLHMPYCCKIECEVTMLS